MNPLFWTLHRDLPREGPGETSDVAWAMGAAGVGPQARVADVACGPGADVAALLEGAPRGHVTAIDKTAHFIADVEARFGAEARVTARVGDMLDVGGPYDFVWCAGAAYIVGFARALEVWRGALVPGGCVAFSEPCLFERNGRTVAFWDGYEALDEPGIRAAVEGVGYEVLATKRVSDAAWENYYGPYDARVAALRAEGDPEMVAYLETEGLESARWRAVKRETGYLLSVVRPCR